MSNRNRFVALFLCIFGGYLGLHHFYAGRWKMGILYLLTVGLCGIGWILDIILIWTEHYKDVNGLLIKSKSESTEYLKPISSYQPSHTPITPNKPNFSTVTAPERTDNKQLKYSDEYLKPASAGHSSNMPVPPNKSNFSTVTVPKEIDNQPLKYKYSDVKLCVIAGQEPDYNGIIERIKNEPIIVSLEIESDNQYDNKAIKVMDGTNKLGYLYQGKIKDMAYDYIIQKRPIFSCLSTIDLDTNEIKMFLGFYYQKPYSKTVTFKLTANSNSAMQDNIMCCSEGDELTFYYDSEKDKYCFEGFDIIGYAPASKSEFLEQVEYDCKATINEIDTNDSGKYYVSVKIEYDDMDIEK